MEKEFWLDKWQTKEIGFHAAKPNPLLVRYFDALKIEPGSRVFLPLCGKTLDIGWFLRSGYSVAGVELSEIAVTELFDELEVVPTIKTDGAFKHFSAPGIDIFVGDFFELTRTLLGKVDAVYDRAAMVALPEETRKKYAAHLALITEGASQFLLCFEYDQSKMAGPPFAISPEEIRGHYAASFNVEELMRVKVPRGLGGTDAFEVAWLIGKRRIP